LKLIRKRKERCMQWQGAAFCIPSVMTAFGEAVLTKSLMQTILIVLALREIKAHHNSITGRGFAAGVGG
jgi:hypothetical protein